MKLPRKIEKVLALVTLFSFSVSLVFPANAIALPTEDRVVKGNVTFDRSQDGVLNITSDSKKSIIKYKDFNIGANESVNFFLPNAKSLSLNKVIGGSGSSILGTLTANGRLILVNPNGINFGSTANVTTGGLIASTLDISDANFLNNNYLFSKDANSPFSSVTNQGTISSNEFAVLLGSAVDNQGVISVPLGTAALASGDVVTVGLSDSGLVSVAIDQAVSGQVLDANGNPLTSQIANSGLIEANGGSVLLTAQSLENLFQSAINQTGVVRANAVANNNGTIEITAGGASAELGGSLETSNLHITDGTTVNANDAQLTLQKDWNNEGTFNGGASTVTFTDASQVSNISGDNTFYDFSVITPGKIIAFEAGSLQTILGTWKTQGAYGEHVRLISQTPGEQWLVDPRGVRDLTYTWVEDSYNVNPSEIVMTESTSQGNNFNWDPIATWTNAGGDNLWSNTLNWSGLGGALPGAGDDVVFNGTGNSASYIDSKFLGIIGSLSLNAGFASVLTFFRALTVTIASGRTGNVTLDSGTLDLNGQTLNVAGNWTKTGGTFSPGIGTVAFNRASGVQTVTSGGSPFFNLTHSGAGTLQLGGALSVAGNFTNTAGTLALNGNNMTASGNWTFSAGIFQPGSNSVTFDAACTQLVNHAVSALSPFWNFIHTGTGLLQLTGILKTNLLTNQAGAGSFDANGKAVTVTGITSILGGTYLTKIGLQTFNGAFNLNGGTFTGSTGTVDMNADLNFVSGTLNAPTGPFLVSGNWNKTGGTFNQGTGTVTFDKTAGTQALNGGGTSFNNLTHSGLGTLQLVTSPLTVNGVLNNNAGVLDLNGQNITISGLFNNLAMFRLQGAETTTLTQDSNSGLWEYVGDGGGGGSTFTIKEFGATDYFNLRINATDPTEVFQLGAAGKIAGTLTLDSGIFSLNGNAATITTLSNNSTFRLRGDETVTLALNDINSGAWEYVGDGAAGTPSYTLRDFGAIDYFNLRINGDATETFSSALLQPKTIAGTLTVSGGTFDANTTATTVTGLTTVNGGTYNGSTALQTFNGGLTASSGTFNGGSGTTDINGNLLINGGTLNATSGLMFVSGNFTVSSGTFSEGTGTVVLDGGNATVGVAGGAETFNNLTINSLGTKTIAGGDTLTVAGLLTLTNGNMDTGTINAQGGLSHGIGFDGGTGTITFAGTPVPTVVSLTGGGQLPNVNLNDSDVTINGPVAGIVTFDGGLTVSAGILNGGVGALVINGPYSQSGGTVTLGAGAFTLNNNFSQSGGTFTGGIGALDINGNISMSAGTFNAPPGPGLFTVSGNWSNTGAVFNPGAGTVTFDGPVATTQTLNSGGDSFFNITHSGLGTLQLVTNPLTVSGTLNNNAGVFDLNGQNFTLTGLFNNLATLRLRGLEVISLGITGNDIDSGTWEYVGDGGGGTTIFTIKDFGVTDYFNLRINGNANEIFQLGNAGVIAGTLTIDSGTFSLNGNPVTITTLSNNSTFRLHGDEIVTLALNDTNSGTWEYRGDNDGLADPLYTIKDFGVTDYFNLQINSDDGTIDTFSVNPLLPLTVAGDFTLDDGTVNLGAQIMTVTGDWTQNAGTFNAGTGTVIFNRITGTQTLDPIDSFFNITHSGLGTLQLNNDLTVGAGGSFLNNAGVFSLDGNNWTMTGATFSNLATVRLEGGETIPGLTQDIDSGTWEYVGNGGAGATTFDLKDFGATDYFNLIINAQPSGNNDIFRLLNPLAIDGTLTVTSGVLSLNGNNISDGIGGTTAIRGNIAGTIRLRGDETVFWTTNDIDSGTWEYRGVNNGINVLYDIKDFGATDYFNLLINPDDPGEDTFRATLPLAIAGTLTVDGTYNANGQTTTVTGLTSVTGNGIYNASSALQTFNGGLTINGGIFNGDTGIQDINGNLSITGGGTLNATSNSMFVSGDFTLGGGGSIFNAGSGIVVLDGVSGTINVPGSITFSNLTLAHTGSKFISGTDTLIVNNTLTLTNGTIDSGAGASIDTRNQITHGIGFDGGTSTIEITGATARTIILTGGGQMPNVDLNTATATLNGPISGITTFDGGLTIQNGTFNGSPTPGAVVLNGPFDQSGGIVNLSTGAFTVNNTFDISGGTFNGSTGLLDVNGDVTLSGGIFNAPTSLFTVSGDWSSTAGTFSPGAGTVTFDRATGIQTVDNTLTGFNNLTHSGLGTLQLLNNTLDVNGNFTNTAGIFDMNTENMTVGGNWTKMGGTFLPQIRTVTFDGAAGTQFLNSGVGGSFFNLTHSGAGTLQLVTSPLVVTNNFVNSGGTFDANGIAATFNGLATVSGGTYLAKTGLQTFNGSGLTISGGTFTGSTGTVDVNGNLNLSSGTLNAPTGPFLISGDWNKTGGTFTPGTGTITFDKALGTPQTLNSGASAFNNVTHSGAGTLQLVTNPLTVGGILNNNAGVLDMNGQNLTVTGLFNNLATVRLRGTETASLTQDINSGTWEYVGDGAGGTTTFTIQDFVGAADYFNLRINATDPTEVFQLGAAGKIAGTLTLDSGIFSLNGNAATITTLSNNSTFRLQGGTDIVTLALNDINSGTWEYVGTNNASGQTFNIKDFGVTDYFNLLINATDGLDTFQIAAPLGATTVAGNLTINNGIFSLNGRPLTLTGNFDNNSTFTHVNGTVIFNRATGTQTLDAGGSPFFNLTHSGAGTLQLVNTPLTVANIFSNNLGTFDLNGQDWTMTGPQLSNLATVKLRGNEIVTFANGNDINTGTWMYVGNGDTNTDTFTVKDFAAIATAADYFHLAINGTDANDVFQLGNSLALDGTLTVSRGVLSLNGNPIANANGGLTAIRGNIAGTIRLNGTESVFWIVNDIDSGTWEYVGDGGAGLTTFTLKDFGATDYYNLRIAGDVTETFNSTAAKTIAYTFNVKSGAYDANGRTTLTTNIAAVSGGTYLASSATQTFNNFLTILSGTFTGSTGAVDLNNSLRILGGTFTAPTTGAFTVAGHWWSTGGTFTAGPGTVTFDGALLQTLDAGNDNFNILRHTGVSVLQLINNNPIIGGTFTNLGGNFDANCLDIIFGGLVTMTKGIYLAKDGIQTFNAGLTLNGGFFTGANGTVDINGNLTLTTGIFTASNALGILTLSGNLTKTSGIFTHNGGTLTLDGLDQTITGANTFFNLTKTDTTNDSTDRTLTFKNAVTQTVLGALTLQGIDGDDRVNLRSTSFGSRWNINPIGTELINFADVQDSSSLSAITATNSIGLTQNNINWPGLS